ncbi:hypothetical protein F2Q68_00041310 [Brassica cretica]|uniref:Uncharacterized protein n=2 Tax=Brassica cretica TaxID=69181 RepID=A0A3N6PUT4_BRACR|nr:hypothetical protein F2Q68_00041310 [Brassica cretica]KAF3547569.1 hypothetical protein DY000_02002926 [Brassica cretica]
MSQRLELEARIFLKTSGQLVVACVYAATNNGCSGVFSSLHFGQESFAVDKILKYISFSSFKEPIFLRNKLHDSSTVSLEEFLAKYKKQSSSSFVMDGDETDRDEFSSYDAMLAALDFTQRYKLRRPEMYFQAHRFKLVYK